MMNLSSEICCEARKWMGLSRIGVQSSDLLLAALNFWVLLLE
jgi:hypothetical protein